VRRAHVRPPALLVTQSVSATSFFRVLSIQILKHTYMTYHVHHDGVLNESCKWHKVVYTTITTLIIYLYENCPDNIEPKPLDSWEGM
jgi:hypothetical protein